MARKETIELYQFDELDDSAKEKARAWWRECEVYHFDASGALEAAETAAKILGIDFDTESVTLMGGGHRRKPKIFYSGFSSQGDGASWHGSYSYKAGSLKAIKTEFPTDSTLHAIARDLFDAQRKQFYKLQARVSRNYRSGNYYHENTMLIEVEHCDDSYRDIGKAGDQIEEALKDFARWIYRTLESEYEYMMSDENVDECIRINEYEFTEDGERY